MQSLYNYARELGVSVEYTDLAGRIGGYRHDLQHIRIQSGMLYRKERSVLAHELAHATFGDEPSMFSHINVKQERRADEWAAHFLIDPRDYELAESRYSTHTELIAEELCVLERLVMVYRHTLRRIGDTVYVSPRMGAGRWDQRFEVA